VLKPLGHSAWCCLLARFARCFGWKVVIGPGGHREKNRFNFLTGFRKFIYDFEWYLAMVGAGQDSEGFEFSKSIGQCFWADSNKLRLKLAESTRSLE
jgi:hypothetical protein